MPTRKDGYVLHRNAESSEDESAEHEKRAGSSKQARRALIRKSNPSPERTSAAATELQRVWRGYKTRCHLSKSIKPTTGGSGKEEGDEPDGSAQHELDGNGDTAAIQPSGRCRPCCLQRLVSGPKVFALWLALYIVMKVASGLYTGATINTMEKQFKLSSTESGAIRVLNDAMDLALVLPVTYFGQSMHQPRLIAIGTLVSGLGMILCAVPHLSLEPYTDIPAGCNQTQAFDDYCTLEKTVEDPCEVDFKQPAVNPVVWMILGQIVVGIGAVPIKPLGTTYIDDAVGKHTTPLYIASFFIGAAAGSMFGTLLATASLSLFVDFDRVPPEDRPTLNNNDPRYIGAWWLGYIVIGVIVILNSIPFFFFPRHLPKTKERMKEEAEQKALQAGSEQLGRVTSEGSTNEDGSNGKLSFWNKSRTVLAKMYYSYKKLLLNVALVLLCLSSAAASAVNAGVMAFGFKYYDVILQVPDSIAPLFSLALIPFLIIGNLLGGYFIRKKKLSPAKCALILLLGELFGILCAPAFLLIGCDTVSLAGISAPYQPPPPYSGDLPTPTGLPTPIPHSAEQAVSPCNMNCTCIDEGYNPVCGSDGLTYVSPCYAGCEVFMETNQSVKSFSDCQCIDDVSPTAVDGQCQSACSPWNIPVILVISIIKYFLTSIGSTAYPLITLRIVDEEMRAAALGFQTILLNLLGYLITPIYFGALVSFSCILWGYDDGQRGACWVYSNELFRYTFQGALFVINLISTLLLASVYLLLRGSKGNKYKRLEETVDETPEDNCEI